MRAIKNGTLIATPIGNVPIEQLKLNNYVFDQFGKSTKVIGIKSNIYTLGYKLQFQSDQSVVTSADQLWETLNMWQTPKVVTSSDINSTGTGFTYHDKFRFRYRILQNGPVKYRDLKLPVDPYVLGVLLGDFKTGQQEITISSIDKFVIDKFSKLLPRKNTPQCWKNTNYWHFKLETPYNGRNSSTIINYQIDDLLRGQIKLNKHAQSFIPTQYLIGSEKERVALVQGLMDTNGSVSLGGFPYFQSSSKQLAFDFANLLRSLGYATSINVHCPSSNRTRTNTYQVSIFNTLDRKKLITLPRKLNRMKDFSSYRLSKYTPITKVETTRKTQMTSLIVDSDNHTFLTGSYVPIHDATNITKGVSK